MSGDLDAIAEPVLPYRCERCGLQGSDVRLHENGDPKRLGNDWRLMPLHPACFTAWQTDVDSGQLPARDQLRGVGPEVDYGHHWRLPTGQRARLTWNVATGVLYLEHPERNKGASALLVQPVRDQVEDLLTGWDTTSQGSLDWLAQRLWLAGVTLPAWALSLSRQD